MRIIDAHAHAFSDALADRAIPYLEKQAGIKAVLDGKVKSLLASMDRAGIEASVICSIATKPDQFEPILKWSREVASSRLIPLASVHPDDADAVAHIRAAKKAGLKGIKLHPYYQDFDLDEERVFPIYETVQAEGMVLVAHTGFDIAFPRARRADPARVVNVLAHFPKLKFVATHLGAWEDWNDVRRHLLGKRIYMEISCSLEHLAPDEARDMIDSHPEDYVLFGSDSPWYDQAEALQHLQALDLDEERLEHVAGINAARLFGRF